jgi:epoxyqueuosine reductase
VTSSAAVTEPRLKELIKREARRLGFVLAGVTTPDQPQHIGVLEGWLARGRHASMAYMSEPRSLEGRRDPHLLMPGCKSILVMAVPYSAPKPAREEGTLPARAEGRIAAYAWGADYHRILPDRLKAIVRFIERHIGRGVKARLFTDSAPILERDLAQRAGLGWIGKNSCLINPKLGSYVLLAEIFLDVYLEPDSALSTDHCGSCTRCIESCPTECILPDRTLDAGRCISYLTIELRDEIPPELRVAAGNWVFGCDICQMVCPWNRFAPAHGDAEFGESDPLMGADLAHELHVTSDGFKDQYLRTPVNRSKRSGYRRNAAVAIGNTAGPEALSALEAASADEDPLVAEHAVWAIERIRARAADHE